VRASLLRVSLDWCAILGYPLAREEHLSLDTPRDRRQYFAYLLRIWQVTNAGQVGWRASLEDAGTGERRGFADLQGLLRFLEELTNSADQVNVNDKGEQLWFLSLELLAN